MNLSEANNHRGAFALKELVVIVMVGAALLCVLVVELSKARQRSRSVCCNCNLKQIGLSFKLWEGDHKNAFPMAVSTNFGGTAEYLVTGMTFRHLQVMSNELSTPIILVCPSDFRRPMQDFSHGLGNSNVSYFVGLVTNSESPQSFLAGDRNITGGTMLANGITELTTNDFPGWSGDMHKGSGNVALADGSVQQLSATRLRGALTFTGMTTNRLAMP